MIFVSLALAILVVSNVFLVVQLNKLTGGQSMAEQSIPSVQTPAEFLTGKWKSSYFQECYLYFYEDGTFEKVNWVDDSHSYIFSYSKGYLDGYTMIYTHSYGHSRDEQYTETSELPLKESSIFTTITRYGEDAITENWQGHVAGTSDTYTRQK